MVSKHGKKKKKKKKGWSRCERSIPM